MWLEYSLVAALIIWFLMGMADLFKRNSPGPDDPPGKLKITVKETER